MNKVFRTLGLKTLGLKTLGLKTLGLKTLGLSKLGLSTLGVLIGLIAFGLVGATPAQAVKLHFGTQEYLRQIQDVAITGPKGEPLYLGHKYSFHSFLAPYWMTDDGYILGVRGQQSYFRLDEANIKSFQSRGLLPSPLPPYELSLLDYAMGHLLWIVLAVILGLIPLSMLSKRRRKRAQPHLDDGIARHQTGNLQGAIESYSKAVEIDPKFAVAFHLRGKAHAGQNDLKAAISDLTKAIRFEPKFVDALMDRGILMRTSGNYDGAISDFSRVIKLTKDINAHFQRGLSYLGKNDYRRAIADFSKVITSAPDFAEAYRQRAISYGKLGDVSRAQADEATFADMTSAQPVA
jgi:tetratricopeptide (TPR) repeat protein